MEHPRLAHGHLLQLLRSSCGEVHDRHGALAVASKVQGLHWMQDSENLPPNQHPYGVFMALLAPQYTASGGVMPLPHVAASAARRLLKYQHRTKPEPCGLLPLTVLVTGTGLGGVCHSWTAFELAKDSLLSSCRSSDRDLPAVLVDL